MGRTAKSEPTTSAPKTPTSKKRKAEELNDESNDFVIQCPAKPIPKKSGIADVHRDRDDPGDSALAIDFTVRPGSKWTVLKTYRKVTYNEQDFPVGDYVLVNRTNPPPIPPTEDAPAEEVLAFQRKNMWVGRIQQIRGAGTQSDGVDKSPEVYVRVFWLYWPEELPMGTQTYHGHSELVLSNCTDIIDATTISSNADISHWREDDDTADERPLNALFWRQTLDVSKLGKKGTNALSKLRRHCVCNKEYNPDTTMYRCSDSNCNTWNHSGCLHHQLMDDLWSKSQTSSLREYLEQKAAALEVERAEKKKSLGETILVGAGKMVDSVIHAIEGGSEGINEEVSKPLLTEIEVSSKKSPGKKGGRPSGASLTEYERLEAVITTIDVVAGTGIVVAEVKLLSDKSSRNKEPKEWLVKLDCLKCGKPLD